MDNKDFDSEWNPADYKIYTEEEEKTETQPVMRQSQSKTAPAEKKPAAVKNKKKKRKKKSGISPILKTVIAAVIVITLLIIILMKFLPDNTNKFEYFTHEVTQTTQPVVDNTVRVTFPEGYTVYQYAELLESNGVCSKDDFYTAVNTPLEGMEILNAEDRVFLLEGYLFPDTYDFYKNEPAASVVQRFIDNYNSKITDEYKTRAQNLGYTMDEMLTLASMIQKECDYDIDECRNVSSVFHNRLDTSKDIYLGSDVTYFYLKNMADYLGGVDSQKFDDFLLKYYTYSGYRKGLPAGPVCNPGLKAIEAAVSPNETNYHFFLTDESGENFYYAETFEQHQANGRLAGLEGF